MCCAATKRRISTALNIGRKPEGKEPSIAMSTKDFIKKSVLNAFTQYDAPKLAVALLAALALGILIYLVYRKFYTGVVYSRSFAVTLVGMCVLTCMVTLAISTNVVISLGMVGAWGEWHSSVQGLENSDETKTAILEKLLSVAPEERQVQVRLPMFKNLLKDKPELYKRLSFHDDFIVIRPDRWDAEMHEGTDNFDQIVKESPYLVVDGELPWGFWSVGADPDSPSAGWIIDGLQTARRLFLQHFTSLSVIHNYKEQHPNNKFDENNPPEYSMVVWKKTMITEDSLHQHHMPVSDSYFQKKDGTKVERNMFDYIRDHLGYRIELQSLRMPKALEAGKDNLLNLSLINRGFATVFGEHPVYFVLIDDKGKVMEFPTEANPLDWQPFQPEDSTYTPLTHSVDLSLRLPDSVAPGKYRLGLWIPDGSERLKYNSRYAIRCANGDTTWAISDDGKYGVNVLTIVEVK